MTDVMTEALEQERAFLQRIIDEKDEAAESARAYLALLPVFRTYIDGATDRIRNEGLEPGYVIDAIAHAISEMLAGLVTFYNVEIPHADRLIRTMADDVVGRVGERLRRPGMVVVRDGHGHQMLGTLEGIRKEIRA